MKLAIQAMGKPTPEHFFQIKEQKFRIYSVIGKEVTVRPCLGSLSMFIPSISICFGPCILKVLTKFEYTPSLGMYPGS